MPLVTTHSPGSFCWPELATSDAKSALRFYPELFGWTALESSTPSGSYYRFRLGDHVAAAMFELSSEMRDRDVPPHWGAYIAVENADDTAARAKAAGGTLVMGPFDVLTAGRMAVLRDPIGASFVAWQGRTTPGIGVVNEPGALGWTQLNADDPAAAKAFYRAILPWTAEDSSLPNGETYTTWVRPDGPAGGMLPMPADAVGRFPSHWLSYFCVTSVGETCEKALAGGGRSLVAPTDIPGGGSIAVLADPEGAAFGIMTVM